MSTTPRSAQRRRALRSTEPRAVPFNKPFLTGRELEYIQRAHANGHLAGQGEFARRSGEWMESWFGSPRALLTHSCTAALEMSALLADVGSGDEVIMPSFTFVSTANAFVLRGATPVFVDVRPDTLNLDERLLEEAITPRTKAIVPVHYAGVACEMDEILRIARAHRLLVIEDAAQAVLSTYRGRPVGGLGDLAAVSFHETKNVISGEGGALLVNDPALSQRAEIIREKGTDRSRFFRGEVDKYTWVDVGSSYLPGEIIAAFLYAQLESAVAITDRRLAIWRRYHEAFQDLESLGLVRRPVIPDDREHNAHMYYLLLPDLAARTRLIDQLRAAGIQSVFHYVPLHSSPMGIQVGRSVGNLPVTLATSDRLVRLPLWLGMEEHQDRIIDLVWAALVPAARHERELVALAR
jgi:dTDP-4-amino-4,6-dideoxygalactose transaminase